MIEKNIMERASRKDLIFHFVFAVLASIFLVWVIGCAPLPPLEEESKPEPVKTTDMDREAREAEIAKYLSFAYERWKNGEYEVARGHFNKVRELDTEHKQNIYRKWADCFVRSGMIDSAVFAYREGIDYFPDDDYLHNSLAIMHRNAGRYEEAIAEQLEALRISPDTEEYLFPLAEMYEKIDEWIKAVEIYEKLVALFPENKLYNQRVIDIKSLETSCIVRKHISYQVCGFLRKDLACSVFGQADTHTLWVIHGAHDLYFFMSTLHHECPVGIYQFQERDLTGAQTQ